MSKKRKEKCVKLKFKNNAPFFSLSVWVLLRWDAQATRLWGVAPSSLHAPYHRADALSSQVVSILTSYSYAKSPNLKSGQNQKKKRKRKLSLSLCRGTKFTKGKHVSLLCGEVSKSWEGCYLHKEAGRGDTWSRWLLRRQRCCRHVAVNTCTWHSWAPAPVARSKPNPVGLVYINQR